MPKLAKCLPPVSSAGVNAVLLCIGMYHVTALRVDPNNLDCEVVIRTNAISIQINFAV